jgi:hypothetical protein
MWNNRKEFLLNKCYSNNDDCSCFLIHKSSSGFYIISVYVDDLNIIELDINEVCNNLKIEFEMKDLGKTKFCLVLQSKHLPTCILVYQLTYVQKILEKFSMDKAYPSKTLMIISDLERETDPFRPREEGEEVLRSEYPYLSVIGAIIYLANNTIPNIVFIINLFARFSAALTIQHWNRVKDVL